MDIHFLPSVAGIPTGESLKPKRQSEQTGGTFQQVLGEATSKPDKLTDAAKQFEALIIGQVLKAARESSDRGWLGTSDDQAGDLAVEMAEQGLAQGLAARGGLGIAKMVTQNLRHGEAKVANSEPASQDLQTPLSKGSDH